MPAGRPKENKEPVVQTAFQLPVSLDIWLNEEKTLSCRSRNRLVAEALRRFRKQLAEERKRQLTIIEAIALLEEERIGTARFQEGGTTLLVSYEGDEGFRVVIRRPDQPAEIKQFDDQGPLLTWWMHQREEEHSI